MSERNEKKWLELVSRMGSAEEAQLYIDFENSCVEMGAFLDLEDAWKARAEIAAKRERELESALIVAHKFLQYLGFVTLSEEIIKPLAKSKAEGDQ